MNHSTIGVLGLEPVHAIQKKNGKPTKFGRCLDRRPQIGSPKCAALRPCDFHPREVSWWRENPWPKFWRPLLLGGLVGPRQLVLSFSCCRSTSKSFFFGKASDQVLASLSLQCMPNQFSCIPNGGTIQPKFWKINGYNPNMILPKFWSCPWFGNAKKLVGLVGAQTKHTL
jgi:hypothetical protein